MRSKKIPVFLVHGWKSSPKIWNKLTSELESEKIPFRSFNHSDMTNSAPCQIAESLKLYILKMQKETGHSGYFDIICHSMGTSIVRYLLEVLDSELKELKVRQIIALGPPNLGSSMAELFNDPKYGYEIINSLAGVFVPKKYDPKIDKIVQEIRPGSKTIKELKDAGIRSDILYRLILVENKTESPHFFPYFDGKTWEFQQDKGWTQTFKGDGIIPYSDSYLPGAGFDLFPVNDEHFYQNANEYCHIKLPQNQEIIKRIMQYLCDPKTQPQNYFS